MKGITDLLAGAGNENDKMERYLELKKTLHLGPAYEKLKEN